jgi:hypothetical protein
MKAKFEAILRMRRSARLLRSLQFAAPTFLLLLISSWPTAAQTWIQLTPTGTPPTERYSSGRAYDAINDRLILFSGQDANGLPRPTDVWVLSNASGVGGTPKWEQLDPTGEPPLGRESQTVVYDPASNRIIVYGGCSANCGYAMYDAWVLTNANGLGEETPEWIQLPNAPWEAGRTGHSAVYDPVSNRMMVFGGNTAFFNTDRNDVWVLVDANGIGSPGWEKLTPTGTPPAPREGHAAFYDQASKRMIISGGAQFNGPNCCTIVFDDVWALAQANGSGGTPQWIQLTPTGTPPPARVSHSAHYDPTTQRMTIFGGVFDQRPDPAVWFNDVWTLTDATGVNGTPEWIQLAPTGGPMLPRVGYSGGYSPTANRMIVAMGRYDLVTPGLFNEVWVLTDANGITNQAPTANAGDDQTVVSAGSSGTAVTLDGSASSDPDGDSLTYTWTGPFTEGGRTVTGVSPKVTLRPGESTITLVVNDGTVDSDPDTVRVLVKYAFLGFLQPVDNLPTTNVAKAGSAIPVKWGLGGYPGMDIFVAGYPVSGTIPCDTALDTDPIEQTVTAGASSLNYDAAAGQYIYVWKTEKAWGGTCRQLVIKLKDGTYQRANFRFTK